VSVFFIDFGQVLSAIPDNLDPRLKLTDCAVLLVRKGHHSREHIGFITPIARSGGMTINHLEKPGLKSAFAFVLQ